MKIYFGFTVAGDRSTVGTARRLVQLLEELGHDVLTRHLLGEEAAAADRALGPQEVFARDLAWLRQCDVFIGEVSGSSFGLGFEAGYLLATGKAKVVLLYSTAVQNKISLMITGNTLPGCTRVPYSSLAEAEAFINTQIGRAEAAPPIAD